MPEIKIKKTSHHEVMRYIFAGVSTTLVNIGIYQLLIIIGWEYRVSNLIALIICKVYGFFINKLYVFKSHSKDLKELIYETIRYVLTRGLSGGIDFFSLIIFVEYFGFNKVICKYVISVIVIAVNYILGKVIVFTKKTI